MTLGQVQQGTGPSPPPSPVNDRKLTNNCAPTLALPTLDAQHLHINIPWPTWGEVPKYRVALCVQKWLQFGGAGRGGSGIFAIFFQRTPEGRGGGGGGSGVVVGTGKVMTLLQCTPFSVASGVAVQYFLLLSFSLFYELNWCRSVKLLYSCIFCFPVLCCLFLLLVLCFGWCFHLTVLMVVPLCHFYPHHSHHTDTPCSSSDSSPPSAVTAVSAARLCRFRHVILLAAVRRKMHENSIFALRQPDSPLRCTEVDGICMLRYLCVGVEADAHVSASSAPQSCSFSEVVTRGDAIGVIIIKISKALHENCLQR